MAIHLGHERAGAVGLVVAGGSVRFGRLLAAEGMLYGVKPVIIAVVAQALWNLGRTAIKGTRARAARRSRGTVVPTPCQSSSQGASSTPAAPAAPEDEGSEQGPQVVGEEYTMRVAHATSARVVRAEPGRGAFP
jgi:hypothetical protein